MMTEAQTVMQAYGSAREHLADELRRVHLLLELTFLYQQTEGKPLSERSQDVVLKELSDLAEEVDQRLTLTHEAGLSLPALRLQELFGLTAFDRTVLFFCLAPFIDSDFSHYYSELQSVTYRGAPSLELFYSVYAHNLDERMWVLERFSDFAPLRFHSLVATDTSIAGSSGEHQTESPIVIDPYIREFLLGGTFLDAETSQCLSVVNPVEDFEANFYDEDLFRRIEQIVVGLTESSIQARLVDFHGVAGMGRADAASYVTQRLGMPLFKLSVRSLFAQPERNALVRRVIRNVLLHNAGLLIYDTEFLKSEEPEVHLFQSFFFKELLQRCPLVFTLSEEGHRLSEALAAEPKISLRFALPNPRQAAALWEQAYAKYEVSSPPFKPEQLAAKFHFSPRQIDSAVSQSVRQSGARREDPGTLQEAELLQTCRNLTQHSLGKIATRLEWNTAWDMLVLPPDQTEQLQELCARHRYQSKVYHDWGFQERLSYGLGTSALFTGPSGTGKTLAASIIANMLKLEIYKIDLSSVISKYIGETEKNLASIFREAERANAILFFDEADALFGKRTDVKDSHDRYANIETSYLLQKMEEYTGITILASNLKQNMDEAFTRRIQYMVSFPFPDHEEREAIWKRIFPEQVPLGSDIDWDYLAEKLNVTGGHIKNIALTASFYAAEDDSSVSMRHLLHATRREWQKLGRDFIREDFEPYYELGVRA